MIRYDIFAGRNRVDESSSLVMACHVAKSRARDNPEIQHAVEINGETVATYEQRGARMEAWVR